MDSSKYWADVLQVPDNLLQQWRKESPEDLPFTYWCVLNNNLDEDKYLSWARNFYGLPSLDEGQFPYTKFESIFSNNKEVLNWSPAFFPIGEWDGILYVACSEPVIELQFNFPVQFILTKPSYLNTLWQSWNTSSTQNSILDDATAEPVNLNRDQAIPLPATDDLQITVSDNALAEAEQNSIVLDDTEVTANGHTVDTPQGLSLDADLPSLEETNIDDNPLLSENTSAEEDFAIPDGLNLDPMQEGADVIEFPNVPEGMAPLENSAAETPEIPTPIPSDTPSELPTPNETPSGSPSDIFQKPPESFEQALLQVKSKFKSVQILKIQDEELVIAAHDGTGMNPETTISLNVPSLFKIVVRSKQPFHGSVNNTDVHDDFFNKTLAAIPEHVTAAPIFDNANVWGVLVCNGTKDNNNQENLDFACEIAQRLNQVVADAAKAA